MGINPVKLSTVRSVINDTSIATTNRGNNLPPTREGVVQFLVSPEDFRPQHRAIILGVAARLFHSKVLKTSLVLKADVPGLPTRPLMQRSKFVSWFTFICTRNLTTLVYTIFAADLFYLILGCWIRIRCYFVSGISHLWDNIYFNYIEIKNYKAIK